MRSCTLWRNMSSGKVDLKVVLLGKEYGGKTSLVERYIHGKFNETAPYQATIGAAFGARRVTADGQTVTLGIWDTAGSERYESMSRIYYRGARAAIVCYDLTDTSSFERAKFWVNELKTSEEDCTVYLCGTKCDLVSENKAARKVDRHVVEAYREEIGAKDIIETSAKTGHNIEELFSRIAADFVSAVRRETMKPDEDKVQLSLQAPSSHKKKQGCGCS